MKYLRKYKLFENIDGISILKDIISLSYIIEDEGYKLVYFVTEEQKDYDYNRSVIGNGHTYALGSSYDIERKIESLPSNIKLLKVFIEIVADIPRRIRFDIVNKEIRESGLLEEYVSKLKDHLPEYKIETSEDGKPTYVYIYIETKL